MTLTVDQILPNISVDCVIFGFHENQLKVLLLNLKNMNQCALPGGFILNHEHVDQAAVRVLQERTGLDNIFLHQFYLFGDSRRSKPEFPDKLLKGKLVDKEQHKWLSKRFVTLGYYALVEFSKVNAVPDGFSDSCEWYNPAELPKLVLDHDQIIKKALDTLRLQLRYQPIGKNLLPEKFTMPELQALYETILGTKLDRRNFQRKILSYGILVRLNERRKGGAHKAPYLYVFDAVPYQQALDEGLRSGW